MITLDSIIKALAAGLGTGLFVVFAYMMEKLQGDLGERRYSWAIFPLYLSALACALLSFFTNPMVLPFVYIVVMVSVYCAPMTAMAIGMHGAMLSVLLSRQPESCIGALLLPMLAGILLFYAREKEFHYVKKCFALLFINIFACLLFYFLSEREVSAADMILPAIGCVLNFILTLFSLRFYSQNVVNERSRRYISINDTENPLLLELKQKNREEYTIAIHCAYLCDKLAQALKKDEKLSKALGYYHRIGVIRTGKVSDNTLLILEENKFPGDMLEKTEEYCRAQSKKIHSPEVLICIIANDIVSSIRYLSRKKEDKGKDYDRIIDFVFSKREEAGEFDECQMTIGELTELKRLFKAEKMYYDFLR